MERIGTFYLSKQPQIVIARNAVATYSAKRNWINVNDARAFEFRLKDVVDWRRVDKTALSMCDLSSMVTYQRPDHFATTDEWLTSVAVGERAKSFGMPLFYNARGFLDAKSVNSRYQNLRLHTTAGDYPRARMRDMLNSGAAAEDIFFDMRKYFDGIAAARAIGAGASLTHPILIWRDEENGELHWYARGYDVLIFSLYGHAAGAVSNSTVSATPVFVDVSPYSPYEGLHFDVAVVCNANAEELANDSFADSKASIKAYVATMFAACFDEMSAKGYMPNYDKIIPHHLGTDPFKLTTTELAQIVGEPGVAFTAYSGLVAPSEISLAALNSVKGPFDIAAVSPESVKNDATTVAMPNVPQPVALVANRSALSENVSEDIVSRGVAFVRSNWDELRTNWGQLKPYFGSVVATLRDQKQEVEVIEEEKISSEKEKSERPFGLFPSTIHLT